MIPLTILFIKNRKLKRTYESRLMLHTSPHQGCVVFICLHKHQRQRRLRRPFLFFHFLLTLLILRGFLFLNLVEVRTFRSPPHSQFWPKHGDMNAFIVILRATLLLHVYIVLLWSPMILTTFPLKILWRSLMTLKLLWTLRHWKLRSWTLLPTCYVCLCRTTHGDE